MIELDEALRIAKEFIQNVSRTDGKWQLEEVILENDKNIWSVTYSFWRENDVVSSMIAKGIVPSLMLEGRRVYRTVKINAENSQVISMKAGFSERQTELA